MKREELIQKLEDQATFLEEENEHTAAGQKQDIANILKTFTGVSNKRRYKILLEYLVNLWLKPSF